MKKQTKPISLKKQLASAISMMLAAAVALGSSTYAWFVNRSRAEVKDVLFQASAGKNLEIAAAVVETGNAARLGLDEGKQVPQGKAKLLTYYTSVWPELLGKNSFTYPKYEATGTTKFMTPVSADKDLITISDKGSTFYEASGWDSNSKGDGGATVGGYNSYAKVQSNEAGKYICAQMYFRASADMDVYLNEAEWKTFAGTDNSADTTANIPYITYYNPTGATDEDLVTYKEEAKAMASALRIAFVTGSVADETFVETTDPTKVVAQFTENHITDALYNTVSTDNTTNITTDTPIKTTTADGSLWKVAAFGDPVVDTLAKYSLTNASTGTSNRVEPTTDGKTPLFHLTANEPKRVTVYVWLEGTDSDCVSALSAFRAGIYLPFVGTFTENGKIVTYGLDEIVPEDEAVIEPAVDTNTETPGYTVDETAEEPVNTEETAAEGETQTAE